MVANCVSCLLAAYAFARLRFRFRGVWFAFMIGTLLLPGHVLIVPQYILFKTFDWIDTPLPAGACPNCWPRKHSSSS